MHLRTFVFAGDPDDGHHSVYAGCALWDGPDWAGAVQQDPVQGSARRQQQLPQTLWQMSGRPEPGARADCQASGTGWVSSVSHPDVLCLNLRLFIFFFCLTGVRRSWLWLPPGGVLPNSDWPAERAAGGNQRLFWQGGSAHNTEQADCVCTACCFRQRCRFPLALYLNHFRASQ